MKKSYGEDVYNSLADFIDPFKSPRIPIERVEDVKEAIKGFKHSEKMLSDLQRYVVVEETVSDYIDVPMDSVLKVGDIVVVE